MDVDDIKIDDLSLDNTMLFVTDSGKTYWRNGAVCTELTYDKLEKMSVAEFLRSEIKRTERAANEVTIVRNAAAASYGLLVGDCALRFSVTEVREAPMEALARFISDHRMNREARLYNMTQFRLVADIIIGGGRMLVIRVPSSRRIYKSTFRELNDVPYYPPDTWLTLRLTSAMDISGLSIRALVEDSPDLDRVKLGDWPLSNVYRGGAVCLNQVSFSRVLEDMGQLTETARINYVCEQAVSLFFRSEFNLDLFDSGRVDSPRLIKENRSLVGPGKVTGIGMSKILLHVMSKPDGWKSLGLHVTETGRQYLDNL